MLPLTHPNIGLSGTNHVIHLQCPLTDTAWSFRNDILGRCHRDRMGSWDLSSFTSFVPSLCHLEMSWKSDFEGWFTEIMLCLYVWNCCYGDYVWLIVLVCLERANYVKIRKSSPVGSYWSFCCYSVSPVEWFAIFARLATWSIKVFAAGSDDQTLRVLVLIPCRTEIEAMTGRAVSSEEEEDLAKQFSGLDPNRSPF